MSNQWRRQQPGNNNIGVIAFWVVIIAIIGYLFFPNFLRGINTLVNPDPQTTSSINDNLTNSDELSSTYDPSNPDSSDYSNQLTPYFNNTLNSSLYNNIGNTGIATGFWILFVSNGELQQLPVNNQYFTFIQGLINDDVNRISTNTILLANNGQVQQYNVSNEVFSIITNLQIIETRASNNTTNTTPETVPSTPPPSTLINEVVTLINTSTSGFSIDLNPALTGLTTSNFTLVDSSGYTISIKSVSTQDGGTTYTISAALSAGQTYTLTTTYTGYTFETLQVPVGT